MKTLTKTSIIFLLSHMLMHAAVAQSSIAQQDPAATRLIAEEFLKTQATGLPGQVSVVVGAIDPKLKLAGCAAPEAFFPAGGKAWGKTSVGVRCLAPTPWTIYISATVRVMGEYLTTSAPLAQGQIIGLKDISKQKGDLAALPPGILTDPSQAIGRTAVISLSSGMPIRQDVLRIQQAVQQGQSVRVISAGPGFSVSVEAKALTSATEGQMLQAKTSTGQIVSGIAKLGGIVEVAY